MRVFQSTYKDRKGRTRKTTTWYVEFTDHLETVRRFPGLSDRKQTEALGRRIVDLVNLKGSGQTPSPDVSKWIEGLPPRLRTLLAKIGLLDAERVAALRPLLQHLDGPHDAPGFRQHLEAKGNTAKHVDLVCGRAKRLIEGCGFTYWSDVTASRVMAYLNDLRADKAGEGDEVKRGASKQTFNFYLSAFKGFCRWVVRDGRATENPVAHLDGLNVRTDRRHDRRALDVEELRWLLDTTRQGPERFGMTGPARAAVYKLAVESGLRAGEIASLTRGSFALDGDKPSVIVEASYSKHRRRDTLALRPDTAAELRELLAHKLPSTTAFAMPPNYDTADMIRGDLADARQAWLNDAATDQQREERSKTWFLKYADAAGRVADFHALRHTAGSLLAASGAHPKVAQSVMRHSDVNLTLSRYSHVYAGQEADAVAALPDLNAAPRRNSAKATGTYNATADAVGCLRTGDLATGRQTDRSCDSVFPVCLTESGSGGRAVSHAAAPEALADHDAKTLVNAAETVHSQGKDAISACSSSGQSGGLLNRRFQVRVLTGAWADRLYRKGTCSNAGPFCLGKHGLDVHQIVHQAPLGLHVLPPHFRKSVGAGRGVAV